MKSLLRTTLLSLAVGAMLAAAPVSAADRHHRHRDHGRWHGDIRHFDRHDLHRWRSGRWHHGRHNGRHGWWWVVGGVWYFYSSPIYPYPDPYRPNVVIIERDAPPAASGRAWFYCPSKHEYYPYVSTCPRGWERVPAAPYDR